MAVVWVTRAAKGAETTASAVTAMGHEAIVAPVLEVHPIAANLRGLVFDSVIFTSRNGVEAFCRFDDRRDVMAWCVGDATADVARQHGFAEIISAASDGTTGDARGLFDTIKARAARSTRFLYAAPREPSAPLTAWMWAEGLMISQVAVYETRPILPAISEADLARVTHVLIHSAAGGKALEAFLKAHDKFAFTNFCFICMSENAWQGVLSAFGGDAGLPLGVTRRISPFPDEPSMLELIASDEA